jgi:oligoribonuclease
MINLSWIDIETTGLTLEDEILEVACVITTPGLVELAHFTSTVSWSAESVRGMREACSPIVREMHDHGLWDAVSAGPGMTLGQIEHAIGKLMVDYGATRSPMCGSSVHFDRGMLERHSTITKHFHYRNIDVSTVKELARLWSGCPSVGAQPSHRALPDVRESIQLLRSLREQFWVSQ